MVEHLKDDEYDRNDDIIRATTMEVVQCIKQLLLVSPIYKEQVQVGSLSILTPASFLTNM